MVVFTVVGMIIIVVLNTVLTLVNLFKAQGCLEALVSLSLSGLVVFVEILAIVLLWSML